MKGIKEEEDLPIRLYDNDNNIDSESESDDEDDKKCGCWSYFIKLWKRK